MCPVLDYASEIWGYKGYDKIDRIQNRAIRAYLGVHSLAPKLSIQGDMGWTESCIRRQVNMNRKYRSVLAQLRSGILPLEIECVRWKSLEVEERKCKVCDQSSVVSQDESHFLFECSLYNSERSHFIETIDRPDLLRL